MSDVFERQVRRLTRALVDSPVDSPVNSPSTGLFNPYRDRNPELDLARAPEIRRRNLRLYLRTFRNARWVLVGEAAGYNGCRFTGVPFTGEDLLVGARPLPWTDGLGIARACHRDRLSSEMSAKIVWGGIGEKRDVVLWNAVPWHPHRPGELLSNRKPKRPEEERGLELLTTFLEIFENAEPVAVGRVAEQALTRLGYEPKYLRHPSMGGKRLFLEGLARLRKQEATDGQRRWLGDGQQ